MHVDSRRLEIDSLAPVQSWSRRGFVVTGLGAGFALAMQPTLAATAISTPASGLLAGEIAIAVADGELPAYQARPDKPGPHPVVLVVQEIFGVHEYIKDVCRRLAHAGYLAIAPELYARQGDPRRHASIAEIQSEIVARVPDRQVLADLDACAVWAGAHGGDAAALAITGFCWGGRIAWLYAARNPALKAAVAWYGRLVSPVSDNTPQHPLDIAGTLKAPVLGLYGGADQGIPLDSVERMRAALAAGGDAARASRIHVYDGAPHAFHADYRPSYRQAEAADGWQRMLAWFAQHGVERWRPEQRY